MEVLETLPKRMWSLDTGGAAGLGMSPAAILSGEYSGLPDGSTPSAYRL